MGSHYCVANVGQNLSYRTRPEIFRGSASLLHVWRLKSARPPCLEDLADFTPSELGQLNLPKTLQRIEQLEKAELRHALASSADMERESTMRSERRKSNMKEVAMEQLYML